jgi:ketosteroid isomerase-like protein
MGEALDVVKQGYEAFGRRDIPALVSLVADEVEWKESCPATWPYSGLRRNPSEVAGFFGALAGFDDLTSFEPKEFIEAGKHVTVLGYLEGSALDTGQKFKSEWAHVLTVNNGKITRWLGFFDTAARYGH